MRHAFTFILIIFLISCDTVEENGHTQLGVPQAYALLGNFSSVEILSAERFSKTNDLSEIDSEWFLNPESIVVVSLADTAATSGQSKVLLAGFNFDNEDEREFFNRLQRDVPWQSLTVRPQIDITQETLRHRWQRDNIFLFSANETSVQSAAINQFRSSD